MAGNRKKAPARRAESKGTGRRAPAKGRAAEVDRRWAILLFGLGLLLFFLALVPGESAWAWCRGNILFAAFGVSAWLLGPMIIWWAVLIGLERPVFVPVIKGAGFLLVLSGVVLVFSPAKLSGLGFGELLSALLESGRASAFGGGLISIVFGAPLLAGAGPTVARILVILLLAVAVMVLTGVTPADVVRFFGRIGDRVADGMDRYQEPDVGDRQETYEDGGQPADFQKPGRLAAPPRRMTEVDVPLGLQTGAEGGAAAPPQGTPLPPSSAPAFRRSRLDISLGPDGPAVQPGGNPNQKVELGPGGTFGKRALEDAAMGLGDYVPLVPFDSFPGAKQPRQDAPQLLFGEDDPYINLGGAASKLPSGDGLEVEYIPPPPAPEFDLFRSGPAARQPPGAGEEQQPAAVNARQNTPLQPPAAEAAAPAAGEPAAAEGANGLSVDELIDKATPKKEGKPAGTAPKEENVLLPYRIPPVSLLGAQPPQATAGVREEMKRTADLLVGTLASFGVDTRILDISRGPSVTRYEVQPQAGVKISRITNLSDDIALNLAAAGVRIEAPIPGKPAVGIEIPNRVKSTVSIRGILESAAFTGAASPLSIALGKDIAGEEVVADLTKMPHLLIAGSTGSGKSVCVNSIIMSFLYKSGPEDVRMVLIDPKVVELAEYNGIPHLLIPVVTEPKMAAKALGQAVVEMEHRYRLFAEHGVRDINTFNKKAAKDGDTDRMPHIAIIIDELADLMMTAGKDVENYICRIAQKARAAGMHLIVATQRPSVDVITGLIKSNIPSRIAFAVSSQVDSRTILDGAGAEKLLGMGDMLFMPIGANKPVRVQGTYVKDKEISAVLRHVKALATAAYDDGFLSEMDKVQLSGAAGAADRDEEDAGGDVLADPVFQSAVETVLEAGQASTSYLQRRLRLGYARAGRIMDQMERLGIVSEPDGSKPRQVLISRMQWQEMVMNAGQ